MIIISTTSYRGYKIVCEKANGIVAHWLVRGGEYITATTTHNEAVNLIDFTLDGE